MSSAGLLKVGLVIAASVSIVIVKKSDKVAEILNCFRNKLVKRRLSKLEPEKVNFC